MGKKIRVCESTDVWMVIKGEEILLSLLEPPKEGDIISIDEPGDVLYRPSGKDINSLVGKKFLVLKIRGKRDGQDRILVDEV